MRKDHKTFNITSYLPMKLLRKYMRQQLETTWVPWDLILLSTQIIWYGRHTFSLNLNMNHSRFVISKVITIWFLKQNKIWKLSWNAKFCFSHQAKLCNSIKSYDYNQNAPAQFNIPLKNTILTVFWKFLPRWLHLNSFLQLFSYSLSPSTGNFMTSSSLFTVFCFSHFLEKQNCSDRFFSQKIKFHHMCHLVYCKFSNKNTIMNQKLEKKSFHPAVF